VQACAVLQAWLHLVGGMQYWRQVLTKPRPLLLFLFLSLTRWGNGMHEHMCVWRVSEWREGDGQAEKEKGRKRGRGKDN
jgi:hypothetical protein